MAGGQFLFDNGIALSSTDLTADFNRGGSTIDPTGAGCKASDPRFDAKKLLAGVETFDELHQFGHSVLDSGFDHDGTSPLLATYAAGENRIRVFTSISGSLHDTVLTSCTTTSGSGSQTIDALILSGDSLKAYAPQAACVCHGFVALWCMVLKRVDSSSNWDIVGSAMHSSQDSGTSGTWSVLFDDLSSAVQLGVDRGAQWSLQKYFVPYPGAGGAVLEAWLVAADYRLLRFGGTTDPVGGRFFVVRIKRKFVGDTWSAADGTGDKHVMFDMDSLTASGYINSRHAHAGAIVKYSPSGEQLGVRFVGSLGDDLEKNRFVTATLADHADNYTVLSNWTFVDQYHGRSKASGSTSDDGIYNPQSVGMLQARAYLGTEDPTAIFLGADNTSESLSLMRCPATSDGQPSIEHIHGVDTGYFNTPHQYFNNVLHMRTMAPERGTPIVAVSLEEAEGSWNANRYWYQPGAESSSLFGLWASCMVTRKTSDAYTSNVWAAPFGDYLVVSGFGVTNLLYRAKPTVRAMRPLILSPGGRNMLRAGFLYDPPSGSDHTFTALSKDATYGWYDMDGSTRVYLNPQPPSLCDRVFKVKTVQSADNLLATLRISTASTSTANQTGWVTSSGLRQIRFLTLDDSANSRWGLARPSTGTISMDLRDDATTTEPTHSDARVSNHTAWRPHTLTYDSFSMSNGPRVLCRISDIHSDYSSSYTRPCNESYFYLAADQAKDGEGCFSYPQAPQTATSSPWAEGANEKLKISGFDLEGSFTLLMAGMMPEDDWQHRTPRSGNYWPLFTLWSDTNNWIEFGAVVSSNANNGAFRVRYKANGTSGSYDWPRDRGTGSSPLRNDVYWSRNSQLLVGLSYNASSHRLTLLGSLGGDAPRDAGREADLPTPVFGTGFNFDALKFQAAEAEEVVTFRWFGGKAISGTAMSVGDFEEQFQDLSFLDAD